MIRRTFSILTMLTVLSAVLCLPDAGTAREQTRLRAQKRGRLQVVTTLSDYAVLAKAIGGERITANSIVHSVQDPHHIRPKPSFLNMVMKADVLISTGLDLELWLPTVINKSGNKRIRSGEIGYVAVSQGIDLVEKPKVISQIEGDVHVFGNPHITTSPINTKQVAWNITTLIPSAGMVLVGEVMSMTAPPPPSRPPSPCMWLSTDTPDAPRSSRRWRLFLHQEALAPKTMTSSGSANKRRSPHHHHLLWCGP